MEILSDNAMAICKGVTRQENLNEAKGGKCGLRTDEGEISSEPALKDVEFGRDENECRNYQENMVERGEE